MNNILSGYIAIILLLNNILSIYKLMSFFYKFI